MMNFSYPNGIYVFNFFEAKPMTFSYSRIRRAFNLTAYIGIFYLCNMYLMDITVSNSLNVDFKVKFSKAEFSSFMNQATEVGIFLGASSLFFASLMTLYKCLNPINE